MIIETERLRIRKYTWADIDSLYEILSDPETMKYYPKPYDRSGCERWINWCLDSYEKNGFGLWAIELKDTGEFIGDCGISLQVIDGETLHEIGYHVNKKHWRNGYAKEACRAVKDWFFTNTAYGSVYSYMNAENVPSRATAISNGMSYVKTYGNGAEAHAVYRITREQWTSDRNE